VFATVSDINVSLISQGASRVNVTFVVDEAQVADVVRRLHEALLERDPAARQVALPAEESAR
jgi:aspartate kinase